jgi:hypothetical protein
LFINQTMYRAKFDFFVRHFLNCLPVFALQSRKGDLVKRVKR